MEHCFPARSLTSTPVAEKMAACDGKCVRITRIVVTLFLSLAVAAGYVSYLWAQEEGRKTILDFQGAIEPNP